MANYDMLTELLDLPHVRVTNYQLVGKHRLNLLVESTFEAAVCPNCQQVSLAVHDASEPQMLRDLPIWNRRCWSRYAPRRFKCATCENTFVERVLCYMDRSGGLVMAVAEPVVLSLLPQGGIELGNCLLGKRILRHADYHV